MTEEREPETEKAIVPTWSDMETGEKIATATAWTLIIGGILAGPHILCSLAGRPLPPLCGRRGSSERLRRYPSGLARHTAWRVHCMRASTGHLYRQALHQT